MTRGFGVAALAAVMGIAAGTVRADECAGNLVRVTDKANVALSSFVAGLDGRASVLLGERHGIAGHGEAAGCLVRLIGQERPVTVVMEHLRQDQQGAVDAYRDRHPELADGLGKHLKWWETGWPAWRNYAPLFDAVWSVRAGLVAGDVARGAPSPDASDLTRSLGEKAFVVKAWSDAMDEAHCGLADKAHLPRLGAQQVVRDQSMARAIEQAGGGVTVLYAGRSHVRKDRAVPLHLGGGAVVSVSLQETADAKGSVDRARVLEDARGRYDYVWFAGSTNELQTCDRLRRSGLLK